MPGVIIVVPGVRGSGSLEEMVPQTESTNLLTYLLTPYLIIILNLIRMAQRPSSVSQVQPCRYLKLHVDPPNYLIINILLKFIPSIARLTSLTLPELNQSSDH